MRNPWIIIAIVFGCTLAGAGLALALPSWLADPARQRAISVAATPLGTLLGLALARSGGWPAVVACGCGYVWSLFLAAALERRLAGPVFGSAQQHQTYFTLAVVFQILAGMAVAVLAARRTREGASAD